MNKRCDKPNGKHQLYLWMQSIPKAQAKKGREFGNAKGIVTPIANNYMF